MKSMGSFSSCHLKFLAMVRAKLQAFLSKQNERSLPSDVFRPFEREEENEDSSLVMMVAVTKGKDESS